MPRPIDIRNSPFRNTVIIYGLGLAALVFILKYFQYRFMIRELSVEIYIGVVAILFTALGIWMGPKLLQRKKEVVAEVQASIDKEEVIRIGLSNREMEVLRLIAQGNSNQEIADKLFISLATVKSHSTKLFGKLDVKRRTEAVHKARSLRIIP